MEKKIDDMLKDLKDRNTRHSKFPYYKIGVVVYNLEEIINKWIKPDLREESIFIVKTYYEISSLDEGLNKHLVEFCVHHDNNIGIIVCLGLDAMYEYIHKKNGYTSENFGFMK
jgi:hypothetical protein